MTYVSYLELQDPDRGSFAIYTFFQTLTAHNLTRIFGIFTIQNIKTRVGLREKGSGANALTFRQNHPTLLISGHPKICGSM